MTYFLRTFPQHLYPSEPIPTLLFHPSKCSGTVYDTFLYLRSGFFQQVRQCAREPCPRSRSTSSSRERKQAVELLFYVFFKTRFLSLAIFLLCRSGLLAPSFRAVPGGFGQGLLLFHYNYRYFGLWKRTQRERTTTT